jgi:hypothetical protein
MFGLTGREDGEDGFHRPGDVCLMCDKGRVGGGWRGEDNYWRVVVVRHGIVTYSSKYVLCGFATTAPESKCP